MLAILVENQEWKEISLGTSVIYAKELYINCLFRIGIQYIFSY